MLKHLLAALATTAFLASPLAMAESWPTRPVKLVVPYPAGGNSDNVARLAASWLTNALGQAVVIENKAGAGGAIGADLVARAPADGYTLLLAPSAVIAMTPQLRSVPYAPSDFVPIASIATAYGIVAARKDLPASNMAELAALAKQHPGKLTFGSAGVATATHISVELVDQALGIQLLHVPFKGSSEALTALVGGQVDIIYDPVALPQIKAGTVKALATSGKGRHPELPAVPTLKEQGINLDINSWFGLFAPKGTPKEVVQRVASAIEKAIAGPSVEKQLATMSVYPDYRGPEAFSKKVGEDVAAYKDLIARKGLKAN